MKISYNWIQDYCKFEGTPRQLVELLGNLGLGLEEYSEVEDDVCLDLEVTSNRNDLNGMIGIAREVAAATGKPLVLPPIQFQTGDKAVEDFVSFDVKNTELCPRYIARIIDGVEMGPSPEWMQKRLRTIGLRPINNVVDISNFVLFETCQPLHAFDYDKLDGNEIYVRNAQAEEKMNAIDGSECKLNPEMLIIADATSPVAVAGVMGGLDSEVSDSTKTLLLESAQFHPVSVRRTARALGMSTDSSYRFEHGVDPGGIDFASRRAAYLMEQLAGGTVCQGKIDIGSVKEEKKQVSIRVPEIERILGLHVPIERVKGILTSLQLEELDSNESQVTVEVPSFRRDIDREIDLIEEIARMEGYHKIPEEPTLRIRSVARPPREKLETIIHHVMNGSGYDEIVTVSFLSEKLAKEVSPWSSGPPIHIKEGLRKEANVLRRSLIPHLIKTKKLNEDQGHLDVYFYEIAHVYLREMPGKDSHEKRVLAFMHDGEFRETKGVLEHISECLGLKKKTQFTAKRFDFLDKNSSAVWTAGDRVLGYLGTIGKALAKQFDIKTSPCVAEVDLDTLLELANFEKQVEPLPKFPSTDRDIAILVPESVTWEQIVKTVESMNVTDMQSVEFFDLYRGKNIEEGHKSIAFRLVFQSPERTLTNEEVNLHRDSIAAKLEKELGGKVR